MSGKESRGSRRNQGDDEAVIAAQMPKVVFADVGKKWYCRIICKSTARAIKRQASSFSPFGLAPKSLQPSKSVS